MRQVILFNKPYGVVCQFSPDGKHPTLKDYIPITDVYAAGRLDTDSEGLLILTDDGRLQHQLAHPMHKLPKTYWVQVEGEVTDAALRNLAQGVDLADFITQPARVERMVEPAQLWSRTPPVRFRQLIPTSWIALTITEGKNRQVRRMTAKVGFPTLRLIRAKIGEFGLDQLAPGQYRSIDENEISGILQKPVNRK
ncbi:pseudouridine synthase [Sulfuriferula thiophila]|uniref:pseudouridine synthase n=1 Tax=Sulfuriferula thiophila TaxID=1781211 RepID=UPI000F608206|nr:pseudouridine synthase [Sulfuriferula thiophila]